MDGWIMVNILSWSLVATTMAIERFVSETCWVGQ